MGDARQQIATAVGHGRTANAFLKALAVVRAHFIERGSDGVSPLVHVLSVGERDNGATQGARPIEDILLVHPVGGGDAFFELVFKGRAEVFLDGSDKVVGLAGLGHGAVHPQVAGSSTRDGAGMGINGAQQNIFVLSCRNLTGPRASQIAATKHEDILLRSVYSHTSPVSGGGAGYLRVNCTVTQPGKADDFVATIKKYLGPTFEDQFKKGVATSYGMDEQYVLNGPGSMRCTVVTFANAENMNKWADAIAATFDKMSADDRKGFQEGIRGSTVPDSRRDMLARITHSAHK